MSRDPFADYNRGLDLIFQEMDDHAAATREQELLSQVRALGASDRVIERWRQTARGIKIAEGKTEAEAHIWADALLRELVTRQMLDERLTLRPEYDE